MFDTRLPAARPIRDRAMEPVHPAEASSGGILDVAIVGAGVGGSLAAIRLARSGLRVALFDLNPVPVHEFRAEQVVGDQVAQLARLDVLAPLARVGAHHKSAINARMGRIVDSTQVDQYGISYDRLVGAIRSAVPPDVRVVFSRVTDIETGPEQQTVVTRDGTRVPARLVILATGLSGALLKRLGIASRTIRKDHSLALGFDVTGGGLARRGAKPFIYYGERPSDAMDYLALFQMGDAQRGNLFCYRAPNDPWVRAFCDDPRVALLDVMPGLGRVLGDFAISKPVDVRSNHLKMAENPVRDGVVLIGDAFQTPCPAVGSGIGRLLSDLDVLCGTHLPQWLLSPGMGAEKIAAYYADPIKLAFDAECLRSAEYRRNVSTEQGLRWALHRTAVFARRRAKSMMAGALSMRGSQQAAAPG